MAALVDLHTHTTASDGALTPAALVGAALAAGLSTIAITDHDTVAGIAPARRAAEGTGLRVLPGVELSAIHGERSFHLLGYGLDPETPVLIEGLAALARRREERARAMVARLAEGGTPVAWERVVAHARGSVGRPHIAEALIEAGYARDVPDAFARLVGSGCPAYLPSSRLSIAEAVAMVRSAGGEVALAHPMRSGKALDPDRLVPELRQAGVSGIEVYHSEHDEAAVQYLCQLATREGFWWSGGSDFHGPAKPGVRLGGVPVPEAVLDQGPFRR